MNKQDIDIKKELLFNLDKIHITELGYERIKRNLHLNSDDILGYLKSLMQNDKMFITKKGKNYYCQMDNTIITINSYNYCIITAHLIDNCYYHTTFKDDEMN